jgi:hypothetical protein
MRKIGIGLLIVVFLMVLSGVGWRTGRVKAQQPDPPSNLTGVVDQSPTGAVIKLPVVSGIVKVCGWCGGVCELNQFGTACPSWSREPIGDKSCVLEGDRCVVKDILIKPTPSCTRRPVCLDANPPCQIMIPIEGWCETPKPTCSPRPICMDSLKSPCIMEEPAGGWCGGGHPAPTPTCTERPACLDAKIACKLPEPAEGWCPVGPTTTPSESVCEVCESGTKPSGDSNCDGKVDLYDFSAWKIEYLRYSGGAVNDVWNADFNCDHKVDLADFTFWKSGYLKGAGVLVPTVGDPIPPPP